jgi:hypothetical protein
MQSRIPKYQVIFTVSRYLRKKDSVAIDYDEICFGLPTVGEIGTDICLG